jgi:hypothetical protein
MASRNNDRAKRIRLTKAEIEKARQVLLREESSKSTSIPRERKYRKDFWRDGLYFDSYDWCWGLDENLSNVCLGRTKDVLKRESSFRREKENHSCHSKLKNDAPGISSGGAKSIVATYRKDPRFLKLLQYLISKGHGIRAIHSELKAKRYQIPVRTLGRWVKQQRELRNDSR